MDALILNGLKKDDHSSHAIYEIVKNELESFGWNVQSVILYNTELEDCIACFNCWIRTPGVCVFDDSERKILKMFVESELVIYLTPIVFGGYSSELKKAVDRLIPLISPLFMKYKGETHHKARYDAYPSLVGIGVLPQYDAEKEKVFKTLVMRNALNLHSPAHAAGVVLISQETKEIREKIRKILLKAEVGN
jgi:multimeric flavodoxin WrbA